MRRIRDRIFNRRRSRLPQEAEGIAAEEALLARANDPPSDELPPLRTPGSGDAALELSSAIAEQQIEDPILVVDPAFQYSPLEPGHFRLLQVMREEDEEAASYTDITLKGWLYDVPYDTTQEYFALSYVWGDSTPCEEITVDGKKLKITASCAAVLRRMMKGKMSRVLWVDSICIDQSNTPQGLAERSIQVAMMDKIYKGAFRVLIYLGEGDDDSDVACSSVKALFDAMNGALTPGPEQDAHRKAYEKLADDVLETTTKYEHGKLHGLFRNPWFKRMWVIQELAMAKRAAFYCGYHIMDTMHIVVGADFSLLPYSRLDSSVSARHWRSYLGYHYLLRGSLQDREKGEPLSSLNLSLSEILLGCGMRFEATRPEDKIYGLYSLIKRLGFDMVAPDYNKPITVVYTEAAEAIILADGNPAYLNRIGDSSIRSAGVPSWVPDFSDFIGKWSKTNPPSFQGGFRTSPLVSGSSDWDFKLDSANRTLAIKGRRLDTLRAVGQPWELDSTVSMLSSATDTKFDHGARFTSLINCIGSWADVARERGTGRTDKSTIESLAKVFSNNLATPIPPASFEKLVRCLTVLLGTTLSTDQVIRTRLMGPYDNQFFGVTAGEYSVSHEMNQMISNYMYQLGWMTICRTTDGNLGITGHSAKPGDTLVVFHGSSFVSVLRPNEGGYRYIAAASIEGLMDGEGWNAQSTGDDQWFTLV